MRRQDQHMATHLIMHPCSGTKGAAEGWLGSTLMPPSFNKLGETAFTGTAGRHSLTLARPLTVLNTTARIKYSATYFQFQANGGDLFSVSCGSTLQLKNDFPASLNI